MGIRYYCSGFDRENDFHQDLIDYLMLDIKGLDKLVFIPSDFYKKEKIERNTKEFTNMFNKSNFAFKDVVVLNENMSKEEMQNNIRSANVVFLMGGNPNTQLDILETYSLKDAIRITDSVVMGMSAGAMCMSSYSMLLPVNEKYPIMDIREGMNLSGISIYPHYNSNGEVLDTLTVDDAETKKEDLLFASANYGSMYLLGDNSEIREENGKLSFIGNDIIYLSDDGIQLINNTMLTK